MQSKKRSTSLPLYPDARYGQHAFALFKNYVNHARVIHLTGNPDYYRRMDRLQALDRLATYVRYLRGRNRAIVCRMIPALKPDLELVLPVTANKSYNATRQRLSYLLVLCEKVNQE
jgi:hypothetical protein